MATNTGQGFHYRIKGFDQFIRDLGATPERVKTAEKVFLHMAAMTVMVWAKEDAQGEGGVAAKASVDLRTGGPGKLRYGGKPYDMGAEFGSYKYKQFHSWRGSGDDSGYFLWPAIRRFRDTEMLNMWIEQAWGAMSSAFTD